MNLHEAQLEATTDVIRALAASLRTAAIARSKEMQGGMQVLRAATAENVAALEASLADGNKSEKKRADGRGGDAQVAAPTLTRACCAVVLRACCVTRGGAVVTPMVDSQTRVPL